MLNVAEKDFLEPFRIRESQKAEGVPIFYHGAVGTTPIFLSEYVCPQDGQTRKQFVDNAPKRLWLGGGAVVVLVPQGLVSIPDRRHNGSAGPTAQGWAKHKEGHDLSLAAIRELGEELIVYTLAGEGDNLYQPCTQIVPVGIAPKNRVKALNLPLGYSTEYGLIEHLCWSFNHTDRSLAYVGLWDLRRLPGVGRLRIIWGDDFPGERLPGTNPRVLDLCTKKEVGRFEGLQGYLPNDMDFHPVVTSSFRELTDL